MRRGRFAPTPSGELHIGNAMTALLAWLQIRSAGGVFVLRMEDLDRPRCRPEYARQILDDLRWLGIDWDEGPDVDGTYGPYDQSRRTGHYQEALERLDRHGRLYPCFCSRKELWDLARAPHGISSGPPVYPGTCRHLTPAERAEKAAVKSPSLRFILPERPTSFHDLTAEAQTFLPGFGGDFVVKRADGIISYQLAVTVDDAAMHITDVLRGSDLLDSTPRQIALYEALGFPVPRFAHVPLLHGPDGKPLSKRHGSMITLASLRSKGAKPEDVAGNLAYLSGLIRRPEPLQAPDLIADFDMGKVPGEPVTVDKALLRRFTG